MNRLQSLLAAEDVLVLDGAMGTMLMEAGLEDGAAPELWNVEHPDRVRAVHRGYIQAGSRLILTNSFGGNRFRLQGHDLGDRVSELNQAAAENARAEADAAPHPVLVAGSIGPSGELMEPMGALTSQAAQQGFAEQAAALAKGCVDLIWIETMSDLSEVEAAVAGARQATDLPIAATMSFDTRGHTMMGVSPQQAVEALGKLDLWILGANCGTGPEELEEVIKAMRLANPEAVLVAKANAGVPHWEGKDLVYDGDPAVMADYAVRVRDLGARMIGACCGSTPAHIQAMAQALGKTAPDVTV